MASAWHSYIYLQNRAVIGLEQVLSGKGCAFRQAWTHSVNARFFH